MQGTHIGQIQHLEKKAFLSCRALRSRWYAAYLNMTKELLDLIERGEPHSIVPVEQFIDEEQTNIDKQVLLEEEEMQTCRLFLYEFDQQTNHLNDCHGQI